ncbi:unnamed protein product [Cylicocyclus nassatus]|uniref:Uncharacterized protein n=1 Tax=Cylicocyclus nassatus TaxID=53992 RepID=A0AA36GVN9_CYLNA|nr:unnamed protein product [Cylicocyclus nassatus]
MRSVICEEVMRAEDTTDDRTSQFLHLARTVVETREWARPRSQQPHDKLGNEVTEIENMSLTATDDNITYPVDVITHFEISCNQFFTQLLPRVFNMFFKAVRVSVVVASQRSTKNYAVPIVYLFWFRRRRA